MMSCAQTEEMIRLHTEVVIAKTAINRQRELKAQVVDIGPGSPRRQLKIAQEALDQFCSTVYHEP